MGDDLGLIWELANPLGILVDEAADAWHAGAVRDVLPISPDAVIVAADTGGLWIAYQSGTSLPIADLDKPDFWCLAQGTHAAEHHYAGGRGLFETDLAATIPRLTWREIPLTYQVIGSDGLPVVHPIGTVYRISLARSVGRIVIATVSGVFWSPIPPAPDKPPGCLGGLLGKKPGTPTNLSYVWRKAVNLPDSELGYLGLAIGGNEREPVVAVASWGTPKLAAEFWWGQWEGGDLVMRRSKVRDDLGRIYARATTMTASGADPGRMYAISSNDDGFAYAMWRSNDAGRNWQPFVPKLTSPKTPFDVAGGNLGNDWGRPCNCIAASRTKADTVAVGWRFGGFFVSEDAGATFRRTDDSSHAHSDIHSITFDPTDPTDERIYIGGDGGVTMAPGLGKDAKQFVSLYNRQLANLQYVGSPSRTFYGSTTPSLRHPGLLTGGLQDNGNTSSPLAPLGPSRHYQQGDGFLSTFIETGHVLFNSNGQPIVHRGEWDPAQGVVTNGTWIPVTAGDPQLPLNALSEPALARVVAPGWRNRDGQLMYAIAGFRTSIFGYFSDPDGKGCHWEFLARFNLNEWAVGEPYYVTALGSFDGALLYVGTAGGRIIAFDQRTRVAHECTVPVRSNPNGDPDAAVHRFAVAHDGLAFATFNRGLYTSDAGRYYIWGTGYVLRVRPPHSQVLAPLPVEGYYGLEVARGPAREAPALFASTDAAVYVSRDPGDALGDTWLRAVRGLPRRPHCGDLNHVAPPGDARWLYLATYGRSVYRMRV